MQNFPPLLASGLGFIHHFKLTAPLVRQGDLTVTCDKTIYQQSRRAERLLCHSSNMKWLEDILEAEHIFWWFLLAAGLGLVLYLALR